MFNCVLKHSATTSNPGGFCDKCVEQFIQQYLFLPQKLKSHIWRSTAKFSMKRFNTYKRIYVAEILKISTTLKSCEQGSFLLSLYDINKQGLK